LKKECEKRKGGVEGSLGHGYVFHPPGRDAGPVMHLRVKDYDPKIIFLKALGLIQAMFLSGALP
jgi:hypothetical protein